MCGLTIRTCKFDRGAGPRAGTNGRSAVLGVDLHVRVDGIVGVRANRFATVEQTPGSKPLRARSA